MRYFCRIYKSITASSIVFVVSSETAVQLQQLTDEIEWQLYTPFVDNTKMKTMYDRAHDLIQLLNTYRG